MYIKVSCYYLTHLDLFSPFSRGYNGLFLEDVAKYLYKIKPSGDNRMALQSPGIQVTVIDESFYTPAEAGTTPLIVIATSQNKSNASGTGVAQGTLKANAGRAYRVSSQRELADLFGVPTFRRTVSGSPIHGGEQNEYGLQAAFSFLGVAGSAFLVRADINLDELTAAASAPGSEPLDGQWWLDSRETSWGIFEWDSTAASAGGQRFVVKSPIVITEENIENVGAGNVPASGLGRVGDYAVVVIDGIIKMYFKGADPTGSISWQIIGSPEWKNFWPAVTLPVTLGAAVQFTINGTLIDVTGISDVDALVNDINSKSIAGISAAKDDDSISLFLQGSDDSSTPIITLEEVSSGALSTVFGLPAGTAVKDYFGPELVLDPHTRVPQWRSIGNAPRPTGSVWVKTTDPNSGARWRIKRYNELTKAWIEQNAPLHANGQSAIFSLDRNGGGLGIPRDTLYVQYNYEEDTGYDSTPPLATFKIFTRRSTRPTSVTSGLVNPSVLGSEYTLVIAESLVGLATLSNEYTVVVGGPGETVTANMIAEAINSVGSVNIEASVSAGRVVITHVTGGEIRVRDDNDLFANIGLVPTEVIGLNVDPSGVYDYIISNWAPLAPNYIASNTAPINDPVDGQLWYSSRVDEIDIMIHNGLGWVSYRDVSAFPNTDPNGPIVSATRPRTFSDGETSIDSQAQDGQLWISTADLENYPTIYRWNGSTLKWDLLDKTDQTSEIGIIFADARYGISGETGDVAAPIIELLSSNYLDPDAPDPALYPQGMLLWNTRRSGFNVKRYSVNHINTSEDNPRQGGEQMIDYAPNRWVTASGNNEDGSGSFGRMAQRKVVIESLKSMIDTNSDIREEESRNFNLIACPGYPETISNLVNLNLDRGVTSFVVGDTPFRLKSDSTTLSDWGNNSNGAVDNGDKGIVTSDPYAAVFYPSGLTTDNLGRNIVVPSSHMMLRTMALSDQVSYPWFAPAGIRRGGITNATSVGYIDTADGEFKSVALTEGQRDTLYSVNVNPITFFNGVGLVNYGQKTRAPGASSLDRINVARLVVYLRSQLNKLAKPFVFEPNDKITRDEVKQAVESLLLELVGQRALFDYAVVCDESNNTPSRIDRNELYVDIAIEPVKSIEFIYIPLRLKNTGEIAGGI